MPDDKLHTQKRKRVKWPKNDLKMDKQEIKDLISAKIAGQGNQVDSGGALGKVLNEIIDNIPDAASGYGLGGVWSNAEGGPYELPDKTFAILGGNASYSINEETIDVSENNVGVLIYDSDNDDAYSLTEIPVGAGGGAEPTMYTGSWDSAHSVVSITVPYEQHGDIKVGQSVKVHIGERYIIGIIATLESNGEYNPPIGGAVALYGSSETVAKGLYTLEIAS